LNMISTIARPLYRHFSKVLVDNPAKRPAADVGLRLKAGRQAVHCVAARNSARQRAPTTMPWRVKFLLILSLTLEIPLSNISNRLIGDPALMPACRQRRVNLARMYVAPLIAAGTKQPKATCAQ
jgi:ankyrin repeat protein